MVLELWIDPVCGDALKDLPVRPDHAYRIAGLDHICGHLHYTVENAVERHIGDQGRGGPDELDEALLHRGAVANW